MSADLRTRVTELEATIAAVGELLDHTLKNDPLCDQHA